ASSRRWIRSFTKALASGRTAASALACARRSAALGCAKDGPLVVVRKLGTGGATAEPPLPPPWLGIRTTTRAIAPASASRPPSHARRRRLRGDESSEPTRVRSLPVVDRDVRALAGTDVQLPRTRDLLLAVGEHLLPLRDPAGQPSDREEHGEVVGRVAHRLVDQAGVEVDVRIEPPRDEVVVLERDPLELERDLELRVEPRLGEHGVGDALDQLRARVVALVHP